ncbi:MAG: hypothetical protein FJ379_01085 [Verrucomicrobia bacterium]|nr:hypothetical protein [Verrucomicrobiota bacterium]
MSSVASRPLRVLLVAGTLVHGLLAGPLSPDEELKTFRLADPGLVVEPVASEPDVESPVAMAWDESGRLFVVEMRDYPNSESGGRIRQLEDRNQDGHWEQVTVFAEGLPFPTSVLPWSGGVLVTAAPELLFLKDNDGDGRAEERHVLFTGFRPGNPQLRVNGLMWGLDGWVHGANGRSDGELRAIEILRDHQWVRVEDLPEAERTTRLQPRSLRGRDFRFQPGTGRFETLAGRSQFGLARDDWGNRFLSWNTIPLRHEVFPDHFLERQTTTAGQDVLLDCLPSGDVGQVFPRTPPPLVFNNESASHFNALSGLHLLRSPTLGPGYSGNAFVSESLRNLVHRRVLVPEGSTFRAERREPDGTEFLASTDPWFHPVNVATGPDGALYVADFYRRFVEHPAWVATEMRAQVDWATGHRHGRLWRIRRAGKPLMRHEDLALLDARSWVRRLESPNGWTRDTVHRLLVTRDDQTVGPDLRRLIRSDARPETRAQALRIAAQLGLLSRKDLDDAGRDSHPRIREQVAWILAEPKDPEWNPRNDPASPSPRLLDRLASDPDPRVKLATALAIGSEVEDHRRERLLDRIVQSTSDRWIRLAAASSSGRDRPEWFARPSVAGNPSTVRPPPLAAGASVDRDAVIARFRPALDLQGDAGRGAGIARRQCLACHYLLGHGQRIGPDLGGIASKTPETLLSDLLAPSRQVAPDYAAWELTTHDGRRWTGLIASESANRVTLRFPGEPDVSFARDSIAVLRTTGRSLMPEGLETEWTHQDLSDLLAFLRSPEMHLGPPPIR